MSRSMGSTHPATSHKPLQFPSAGFEVLNGSELIEEELAEGYNAKNYYPVKQGEVFNGQYQAILKLGFGATSTIWLSKDLQYVDSYIPVLNSYPDASSILVLANMWH